MNDLLANIERISSKEKKRQIVQGFLRTKPSDEDLLELIESDEVKYSIDLQYVLKLYFTDMEYKKISQQDEKNDWLFLLASLAALPSI